MQIVLNFVEKLYLKLRGTDQSTSYIYLLFQNMQNYFIKLLIYFYKMFV